MYHFLKTCQMGYDGTTGTENSFTFIKSAEVAHGRKTITQMRVPQGGVPRGRLVEHKHNFMKHQTYFNPTKTPGLAHDIRNVLPQTERVRDVHGVKQLPYSIHLRHGH